MEINENKITAFQGRRVVRQSGCHFVSTNYKNLKSDEQLLEFNEIIGFYQLG